jgi:hypothetical protein
MTSPSNTYGAYRPSQVLARCLGVRSVALANLGRLPEAFDQARRSLSMAEDLGDPDAQALAWGTWP